MQAQNLPLCWPLSLERWNVYITAEQDAECMLCAEHIYVHICALFSRWLKSCDHIFWNVSVQLHMQLIAML